MSRGEISERQKLNESMLGKKTGKGSFSPEHAMAHCRAGKQEPEMLGVWHPKSPERAGKKLEERKRRSDG